MEISTKGFVLDVIPANTNPEPQPPAAEDVDLGGLLGHQGGLALPQDQHPGHQLHALRAGGQIAAQHKRFVKHILVRIGPVQPG